MVDLQVASSLSQNPLYSRETVANESAAISPVQIATTQPSSLLASRIQVNAVHSAALASALWQTLVRKSNGEIGHSA